MRQHFDHPIVARQRGAFLPAYSHATDSESESEVDILFLIDRLSEMGGAELALSRLVRELSDYGIRTLVITFGPELCSELVERFPFSVQVFPLRRTYDYGAWQVAHQLRSLIVRHQVRLVHTFFETADLFGGLIVRSVPHVALVTSRRDMGILRGRKHRLAYPILARLSHRVVTVSERVREWCIEADHLHPSRVVTVYNGIDVPARVVPTGDDSTRRVIRDMLGISPMQVTVTSIGHIRHVKGYDVLVEAAVLALRRHPNVVFLVAGGEHEVGRLLELEALVKARKIEGSVRFLGTAQHIPSLLQATDIFLLPSRSEGFSNALIEAMGSGLPCIATDVGGNAEAVVDGVSGFLVPSEDPQAIASALDRLIASGELRRSMGEEGYCIAQARFTQAAMVENMLALYRGALLEVGHSIAGMAENARTP